VWEVGFIIKVGFLFLVTAQNLEIVTKITINNTMWGIEDEDEWI